MKLEACSSLTVAIPPREASLVAVKKEDISDLSDNQLAPDYSVVIKEEPALTAMDFYHKPVDAAISPRKLSWITMKKDGLFGLIDGYCVLDHPTMMISGRIPPATDWPPQKKTCLEQGTTTIIGGPLLEKRPDLSLSVVEEADDEQIVPPGPFWKSADD